MVNMILNEQSGQIRLRRDFRDADEVFGSIDVVGTAGVAAFDERDEIGVRAEEGTGPGVTAGHGENFGPVLAGDQDRIARPPAVGGDRDGGARAWGAACARAVLPGWAAGCAGVAPVGRDQPLDARGADEGLVGQGDHGGAAFIRGQRTQRRKTCRQR